MIIIYNCYGGTHSSTLASAVHLNQLPHDRTPSKEEILNTRLFNKLTYKDMGRLIYRGTDEMGNLVYTIGRGTSKALVPAMRNMASELHKQFAHHESYLFVNTSPTVPISMTLGGFFSRGIGIDFIGVPLLAIGSQRSYDKVVALVDRTKQLCQENKRDWVIMDINTKGQLSILS